MEYTDCRSDPSSPRELFPVNPFLLHLECSSCSKVHSPRQLINLCSCGNPLLVRYDLSAVQTSLSRENLGNRPHTMWRYRELLPPGNSQARISLGEGGTPLVDAKRTASSLGLSRLWIKDEAANPTGSFKARGLSVAVTMAKALGAEKLAIPSAGKRRRSTGRLCRPGRAGSPRFHASRCSAGQPHRVFNPGSSRAFRRWPHHRLRPAGCSAGQGERLVRRRHLEGALPD